MTEATLVAETQHDAAREPVREPARGPAREPARDTDQAAPRPENLPMVLESLLLVAEEPPTVQMLARVTGVSADAVEQALDQIAADESRGIRLRRHGATIALVSAPEAAPWVEALLGLETPNRLSKAALETLAVIAYHQPVTRSSIERVRGVGAGASLRTLRSRDLVQPVGRLETPGQPLLWGVTARFLDHFGLGALAELPPLGDLPAPAQQAILPLEDADAAAD